MNIAIDEYYHGITIDAQSMINQIITKPDNELARILAETKAKTPTNDFYKVLIVAIETEQGKRALGAGATKPLTEDEKYAKLLKNQTTDWIQKFLRSSERNLAAKQSGAAIAEDEAQMIKKIELMKAELKLRGVEPLPAIVTPTTVTPTTVTPTTDSDTIWGIPKIPFIVGASLLGLLVLTVGGAFAFKAVKN